MHTLKKYFFFLSFSDKIVFSLLPFDSPSVTNVVKERKRKQDRKSTVGTTQKIDFAMWLCASWQQLVKSTMSKGQEQVIHYSFVGEMGMLVENKSSFFPLTPPT